MTGERSGPPRNVPTLTEVVGWPEAEQEPVTGPVREPALGPVEQPLRDPPAEPEVPEQDPPLEPVPEREPPVEPVPERDPPPLAADASPPAPEHALQAITPEPAPPPEPVPVAGMAPLDEEQLTRGILLELQRQVDLVLECRVREILTPILTRATDAVVRDARSELSNSLHDLVARSVAQELLRQRSR